MPRRGTLPSTLPVREQGTAPNGHQAPWWRRRNWVTDLATLARLRDALRALPGDELEEADDPGPVASGPAGPVAVEQPSDPAIAAVRETFAAVAEAGDPAISYFYARLFIAAPHLRAMFPAAMDEQRDRLFRALARIVETLAAPEELAAYLSQLGRDHRKYGVTPEMYDGLGGALGATLHAYAREAYTAEAQEAWEQVYAAASAMMIRASEEDASPAYWTAEVVEHTWCGNGVAVMAVATDDVLPYEAGQHVTLCHPRWPRVWRPYSVANQPRDDGLLTFHVKAVPGGWVSNALVHHTRAGDELTIGPAIGGMTLEPAGDRDLLLVAGGTGLSAVTALAGQAVRDALAAGDGRRIHLFCGARTRDALYGLRSLWRLGDVYEGLSVTPVTSDDPAFSGAQGNVGRVAARYLPHGDVEAYAAGPPPMVRDTLRALARAGVPRERIHFDDALLSGRRRVGTGT